MSKFLLFTLLTFCTLLPSRYCYAQVEKSLPQQTASQAKIDPNQDAKIMALHTEIQVLREFTQHMLSTVYFSLGTVLVVLLAMIGFGWYQNIHTYERDKEALLISLKSTVSEETKKGIEEITKDVSRQFESLDVTMAKALQNIRLRMYDAELLTDASIFNATHSGKTPRTDFAALLNRISANLDDVSPHVLDSVLSTVLKHTEIRKDVDSVTRTSLLHLASEVAAKNSVFGERLREILTTKPAS